MFTLIKVFNNYSIYRNNNNGSYIKVRNDYYGALIHSYGCTS